jgi:hypothetical protein
MVLRLISIENNKINILKEIVLKEATNPLIVFSPDGNFFCILMKELGKVIVYEVPNCDMQELFNMIDDGTAEKKVELTDLVSFKNFKWDNDNKFITVYNKVKFIIIDMRVDSDDFG